MDAAPQPVPYRRIGTILVEKELISASQLDHALVEQRETGRPLGEICVDRFGLDRLSLADALAEQWEEMQRLQADASEPGEGPDDERADADPRIDQEAEGELRVLLDEAQAARVELTAKTEELGRRLAALEVLVVGVTDALSELRPAQPQASGGRQATTRRSRSRAARPAAAS